MGVVAVAVPVWARRVLGVVVVAVAAVAGRVARCFVSSSVVSISTIRRSIHQYAIDRRWLLFSCSPAIDPSRPETLEMAHWAPKYCRPSEATDDQLRPTIHETFEHIYHS